MSAVEHAPPENRAPARQPLAPVGSARGERRFWIGFGVAFLVHVLALVGTLASAPKRMGEEKGSRDGVSVVIVDLADLESKSSVPSEPETPPAPPAEAPQPPAPPPQPKTPPQPKQREEVSQQPAQSQAAPQLPPTLPLPDLPGESPKPPQQQKQKQTMHATPTPPTHTPSPPARKPARPSFDLPDFALAPGRMQTAATRPAGITRSGENDEFGRNVIQALARVMPRVNLLGRVTVRILLNEKGNLAEVRVLRPSEDPFLDQNVVFSVKQANFPIPPDASTVLDRTFLVTYIYR